MQLHESYCDGKIIDNVNFNQFRIYLWTKINPKAYRQRYIIGIRRD